MPEVRKTLVEFLEGDLNGLTAWDRLRDGIIEPVVHLVYNGDVIGTNDREEATSSKTLYVPGFVYHLLRELHPNDIHPEKQLLESDLLRRSLSIPDGFSISGYSIPKEFMKLRGDYIDGTSVPGVVRHSRSKSGQAIFELITLDHLDVIIKPVERLSAKQDASGRYRPIEIEPQIAVNF